MFRVVILGQINVKGTITRGVWLLVVGLRLWSRGSTESLYCTSVSRLYLLTQWPRRSQPRGASGFFDTSSVMETP